MPQLINIDDEQFVVDRHLGAVPMSQLLQARATLRTEGRVDRPVQVDADRPVLIGGQALQAGVLYGSERNANLRYYLPEYRVATDEQGRPAVELRYDASQPEPRGSLTVTLTWTAPPAAGLSLSVIQHDASLVLRYAVPVQGAASAALAPTEDRVQLQPLLSTGAQNARSVTLIAGKEQFDAIYQALSHPDRGASLELSLRARVGVQTWRQVVVGRPGISDQIRILEKSGALFTDMLTTPGIATAPPAPAPATVPASPVVHTGPLVFTPATRAPMARPVAMRQPGATLQIRPRAVPLAAAAPVAMAPSAMLAVRPAAPVAAAAAAAPMPVAATAAPISAATTLRLQTRRPSDLGLLQLNRPALDDAIAVSDLKVAGRRVIPVRVALDTQRQPAVIDAQMEASQALAFCFDPAQPANTGVFVAAGYTPSIHLLLPVTLTKDGRSYVVYQDNLMKDVIHLPPSEFRLMRDADQRCLPQISFVASEFSSSAEAGGAAGGVLYRVSVVYRLEPWLDPTVVELTRAWLAEQNLVPRFTTTIPPSAKLSLNAPLDQAEGPPPTIDARGIQGTLNLDQGAFETLWRDFLAPPAPGAVTGVLSYALLDGSPAQVPVRLSLWDSSPQLFDVALADADPAQPDCYIVQLTNRVESPVRIVELPGEMVGPGRAAQPVQRDGLLNRVLQPGEALRIAYSAGPNPPVLADFDPSVFGCLAADNLGALLKLLMVTSGYASLGFVVQVRAADGVFEAPAGSDGPLTGLRVEFDDGSRVTLTRADGDGQVQLLGRLVDRLMGSADDSKRYFYRVTNLHAAGEGARTGWLEGQGAADGQAELKVGSAKVALAF